MIDSAQEVISRAVTLIQDGKCKEAIGILEAHIEQNPDSLEGWYNLGIALTDCERREDAIKAYDEALAIDNEIFEIWFNKGTVLYELADFKGAKECYSKAVEINPDDAEVWNNLGNCNSRLADGRAAIEAYTRAVALKPDYAEAFYNKANAHFVEEEDEKAVAFAEVALELDPTLKRLVDKWIHLSLSRLESARLDAEYRRKPKDRKRILRPEEDSTD